MKTLLTFLVIISALSDIYSQESQEYYQLKEYLFTTVGQEKRTEGFLENAYLPALHRLGLDDIGVFKPIENDTVMHLYVLIPLSSVQEFTQLEEKLMKDKDFTTAGSDYLTAGPEDPPYQRISSTFMKAFPKMPVHHTPELKNDLSKRVYELRSYESPTEMLHINKVKMFNQGGEMELFDKLKFNPVFYADVISGAHMPNLMYMTTFSDRESRDAHWKEFFAAPEWKNLTSSPEYKIKNVSKADVFLLYPTEYSDY